MFERNTGLGAEDDLCASAGRDFLMTADEVGMQVRLNDILDRESLRLRFLDILINIALRIDNRRLALRTNQVRSVRQTPEIELFELHKSIGPIRSIRPIPGYKTPSPVSTDAASSTAAASHRANTYQPDASSPATFCKPHATSSYQQKYHPACRQRQPRAHAQLGASSAFPRSDPDALEKS